MEQDTTLQDITDNLYVEIHPINDEKKILERVGCEKVGDIYRANYRQFTEIIRDLDKGYDSRSMQVKHRIDDSFSLNVIYGDKNDFSIMYKKPIFIIHEREEFETLNPSKPTAYDGESLADINSVMIEASKNISAKFDICNPSEYYDEKFNVSFWKKLKRNYDEGIDGMKVSSGFSFSELPEEAWNTNDPAERAYRRQFKKKAQWYFWFGKHFTTVPEGGNIKDYEGDWHYYNNTEEAMAQLKEDMVTIANAAWYLHNNSPNNINPYPEEDTSEQ